MCIACRASNAVVPRTQGARHNRCMYGFIIFIYIFIIETDMYCSSLHDILYHSAAAMQLFKQASRSTCFSQCTIVVYACSAAQRLTPTKGGQQTWDSSPTPACLYAYLACWYNNLTWPTSQINRIFSCILLNNIQSTLVDQKEALPGTVGWPRSLRIAKEVEASSYHTGINHS